MSTHRFNPKQSAGVVLIVDSSTSQEEVDAFFAPRIDGPVTGHVYHSETQMVSWYVDNLYVFESALGTSIVGVEDYAGNRFSFLPGEQYGNWVGFSPGGVNYID